MSATRGVATYYSYEEEEERSNPFHSAFRHSAFRFRERDREREKRGVPREERRDRGASWRGSTPAPDGCVMKLEDGREFKCKVENLKRTAAATTAATKKTEEEGRQVTSDGKERTRDEGK